MVLGHLNRITRPPGYLQAITQHQQQSISVVSYAFHISESGRDFPPEWFLRSAALVDVEGVAWPLAADKSLKNVWSCTILGPMPEEPLLSLEFEDRWSVRLTEAQKEELQVSDALMPKAEFDARHCRLIAEGNQSARFFERLFIEPTQAEQFICQNKLPELSQRIQSWEIDLGKPSQAIQIALSTS